MGKIKDKYDKPNNKKYSFLKEVISFFFDGLL